MIFFYFICSTSLYTDTECDTTTNGNVPRKTANNKYSVDRSMIDKGNNGYDEFQHSDGKVDLFILHWFYLSSQITLTG